jgi:phosphoribosyl 1,2-cyclic phosphate phosphodiesterase
MRANFTFLGTGSSGGTPTIGCKCEVCCSKSPCNQRLRPAGLLRFENKVILIDSGPDIRLQSLRYGIDHLDGMIITHTHYDHIGGIDDLRSFNCRTKKPLPVLCSAASHDDLVRRYPYMFKLKSADACYTARFMFQLFEHERGIAHFHGINFGYMTYHQGPMQVNGIRIGNFAYVSDIKRYHESIFTDLEGVEILVLSALRNSESYVHFSFADAVEFSRKVGAKITYLTHLSHDIDHDEGNRLLPEEVRLGYDGLQFDFDYLRISDEKRIDE